MKRLVSVLLLLTLFFSCAHADTNTDRFEMAMTDLKSYMDRDHVYNAHKNLSAISNNSNNAQLFKSYAEALLKIHDERFDEVWIDLSILADDVEFQEDLERRELPLCTALLAYVDVKQNIKEGKIEDAFAALYENDGDQIWDVTDLKQSLLRQIIQDKEAAYSFAAQLQSKQEDHPAAASIFRVLRGYTPPPTPTPKPTPKPAATPTPKPTATPVPIKLNVSAQEDYNYLTWNQSGGNYTVYRRVGNWNWAKWTTTKDAYYYDQGITHGKTYYYYVKSDSAKSNEVSVVAKGMPTATPTPTRTPAVASIQLKAIAYEGYIGLSWNNVGGTYEIYKKTGQNGTWSRWETVSTNGFMDYGVSSGTKYFYYVTAGSAKSNDVEVVAKASAPTERPWSGWTMSVDYVSANNNREVRSATQYRYRDTTYGSWSAWSTTPVSPTSSLEVETKTESVTTKKYSYSRYSYYNKDRGYTMYSYADTSQYSYYGGSGKWQSCSQDTPKPKQNKSENGHQFYGNGFPDTWFYENVETKTNNVNMYRSRTKSVGSFTDWSDTKPSEKSGRSIETRTVYWYRTR